MSLYFFLVVIVSLGCGTLPPLEIGLKSPLLATLMMVMAWWILCHVGVRMIAKQAIAGQMQPLVAVQWMERQLAAFRWLGLPVILLCLGGFGLGRVLDGLPVVGHSMTLRACILLMPGLLITTATWSAENYYGMLVGFTSSSIRQHLRVTAMAVRTGAAWLVAPILLMMLLSDAISAVAGDETTASWITSACILVLVPVGLPWLIRYLLKTEAIDAEQTTWMEELLAGVGIARTKILRWNTGGTTFNAMVAGFVPPLRTLLVSDRLLDDLPRDQIAMVVLHEAAHIKRKHMPLRMATVLPAWVVGALVTKLAGDLDYAMTLGTVAGIFMTVLILRLVSYHTEHDADIQACRMAASLRGSVEGVPATYDEAAKSLGLALTRVTFDHPESRKPTWLHPGLKSRLDRMNQDTASPHHRLRETDLCPDI